MIQDKMIPLEITESCIRAVNDGTATIEQLIYVIQELEIEIIAHKELVQELHKNLSLTEAKLVRSQDVLYAVTHGSWQVDAMDKELER